MCIPNCGSPVCESPRREIRGQQRSSVSLHLPPSGLTASTPLKIDDRVVLSLPHSEIEPKMEREAHADNPRLSCCVSLFLTFSDTDDGIAITKRKHKPQKWKRHWTDHRPFFLFQTHHPTRQNPSHPPSNDARVQRNQHPQTLPRG